MCMVMSCACLGLGIPPSYHALNLKNVFSYYAVLGQDLNLSPPWRQASALRVEPRSWVSSFDSATPCSSSLFHLSSYLYILILCASEFFALFYVILEDFLQKKLADLKILLYSLISVFRASWSFDFQKLCRLLKAIIALWICIHD